MVCDVASGGTHYNLGKELCTRLRCYLLQSIAQTKRYFERVAAGWNDPKDDANLKAFDNSPLPDAYTCVVEGRRITASDREKTSAKRKGSEV